MLSYWITRMVAYAFACLTIPTVWYFYPKALLPIINFNGWWVNKLVLYLMAHLPPEFSRALKGYLYLTEKMESIIQWILRWHVAPDVRVHVEVLAKAFLTLGGWLMLGQLTFVIFVLIRIVRWSYKRSTDRIIIEKVRPYE